MLLAALRVASQWASLATLATALVISVAVWKTPVGLALGLALTDSYTSSNALFSNLQKVTAQQIG